MQERIEIRKMRIGDAKIIDDAFLKQGWPSRLAVLNNYFVEQEKGRRDVFVGELEGCVTGYVTLVPLAKNGPFQNKLPEIVDFNVFETFQRQGVGSMLLEAAENEAQKISPAVSLGFGLHSGYGPAQRMYVKRGYIPDGSGVWFNNHHLAEGVPCVNNDELILYLSKQF